MYKFIFSRIAVSLFFAVLLFVIVFKAICIPITFDESAASIYYPKFSVGEIIRYPSSWPSNHILNTLAIKASESIWGIEPWNVRLPNMISFVLFFVVMYLIAQRYFSRSPLLFCLPFAVVLGNPFLIDFFSMARGYGISNMFMVCSVFCMLRHTATYRQRWYFAAIIFSMLAAYANFTLLIFWVAANGLLVMIQIARWLRHERTLFGLLLDILFTTVLAGGFLALCYTPLYKMQSTNQFIYWSKVGFFHDTLLDQVRNFRYGVKYFGIEDIWLAYAVIGVIAAGGVVVLYKIKQQGLASLSDPFVVLYSLLTLVWIINIAQTIILGTPYLTTRTALSYYVLFSLMLIFLIRDAGESKPWVNVTLVPAMTFLFCLHLALSVNLKYVREWWFDANTYQVIDFLDHYRHNYPEVKTISMSTTWLFNPSFDFYKSTGKLPWMDLSGIHPGVDTTSNTLFYYATSDEARQLKNYIPVKFFEPGTNVLMMHK